MITQMRKCRAAKSPGGFTGNAKVDELVCQVPLLPDYMKEYRLTESDRTMGSDLAKKSLETRSLDCINIEDADALIQKCVQKIKDNTDCPFLLAACMSLVCGRRSVELLKTGVFTEGTDERGQHSCLFKGAAKKKSMCEDECDIPLLIRFKHLIPALRRVREKIPCANLTNTQVNSKHSHKLGDAAKIVTGNMKVRFHDLRALYGMISFRMFENNCSLNIWLKKSLMHESLDTSVFYSRCKIGKCADNIGRWDY